MIQRERLAAFERTRIRLLADNRRIMDELRRVEAYLATRDER